MLGHSGSVITSGDRPHHPGVRGPHQDLIRLHALSGKMGNVDPGFPPGVKPPSTGESLLALAGADEAEVPLSARVHVLYNLLGAAGDPPDWATARDAYRSLAGSVATRRGADTDALLAGIQAAARSGAALASVDLGLAHHDVAFIGEQLCRVEKVTVDGRKAVWIYSEFETDAQLDTIATNWVDPRRWPKIGPLLFKKMDLIGGDPLPIGTLGEDHWHGAFLEEVQLGKTLRTILHCDYWRGARAAGMTYDLDFSTDGEIDVDRGFLSVTDLGDTRLVKALKIVGFTTDIWDYVATTVCPFWTDWVRSAVEGGKSSRPTPHGPESTGRPGAASGDWVDFVTGSAQWYLDLFSDVSGRSLSGSYSAGDWTEDAVRYWSRLAGDWAKAWSIGLDTLRDSSAAVGRPTGPAHGRAAEVRISAMAPGETARCSDLTSIEDPATTIPARRVDVAVIRSAAGGSAVRVVCRDSAVPTGLYVGSLLDGNGAVVAPVQLYVSGVGAAGPP
jgi:hypothetical protein